MRSETSSIGRDERFDGGAAADPRHLHGIFRRICEIIPTGPLQHVVASVGSRIETVFDAASDFTGASPPAMTGASISAIAL